MEGENSDIVIFIGRFHPLILHLPIGFLTIAFVLELMSRLPRFRHFEPSVGFILLLGSLFAVFAAVLGLMLAQSGGYQEALLSYHQWTGIGVAAMSAVAVVLRQISKRKPSQVLHRSYLATMWLMVLTLGATGHFGGSLTHGSDYLTRYMPDGLRGIAGLSPKESGVKKVIVDLDQAVVYEDIIHPILDNYCTSCHNDEKQKGDLMMHTPEYLMKGGESGPAFVAGDAHSSDMIKRILLPEEHDDHMPPAGKRQIPEEDLKLLVWWVNEGAPFDKKVAELNVDNEVMQVLFTLVDPASQMSKAEKLLDSTIAPVSPVTLAKFKTKGVTVSPLANDIHWLQADIAPGLSGDSLVKEFAMVGEHITWLSLSGTSATDSALASLARFKHLTRLHLGNTGITDEGLKYLKDLAYLESLNLYGTNVSDQGLTYLKDLKNLRKLYLWQTKVTPEGISSLEEAMPGLDVVIGQGVD